MTAPTVEEVRDCECGCERSKHKLGKGGCRTLDCDCARYAPDTAQIVTRKPLPPSLEEMLRAAEKERDAALADAQQARAELAEALRSHNHVLLERDEATSVAAGLREGWDHALGQAQQLEGECRLAHQTIQKLTEDLADARADLDTERAELTSARAELEHWRGQRAAARPAPHLGTAVVVARDSDKACERCTQPIRRGEAYEEQPGTGGLAVHVHCPDPAPAEQPTGARIHGYEAWQCFVDGGCGRRYTVAAAAESHPCGPMTPITVTIHHR